MASLSQNVADRFPPGTTVAAYKASNWTTGQRPPSGAPLGSADASSTVAADGTLTLQGLQDLTTYFLTNSSGTPGSMGYVRFHGAPASTATSDPTYLLGGKLEGLTAVENFPLMMAAAGTFASSAMPTLTSGRVHIVYFIPQINLVVDKLAVAAPGITPQFAYTSGATRLGLATVQNPDTSNELLNLVARTALDTTVGTTQNNISEVPLDTTGGFPSTYKLLKGQPYAGLVWSNASTMGKLMALRMPTRYAGNAGGAYVPWKVRHLDSQSDIPTSPFGLGTGTPTQNTMGDCLWFAALSF